MPPETETQAQPTVDEQLAALDDAPVEEPTEDAEPVDDAGTEEEVEETPDPIQVLTDRLGVAEANASKYGAAEGKILSGVGRIEGLQSAVEELRNADPLAPITPQITALETAFSGILNSLIANEVDDSQRAALQGVAQQFEASRQDRMLDERVATRVAAALPQTTPQQVAPQQGDPAVVAIQATGQRLRAYSDGKGLDWESLGDTLNYDLSTETIDVAESRIRGLLDDRVAADAATTRTAARARNAGNGSPARSGGNATIETKLENLGDNGIPQSDVEARREAAAALGLTLEE